VSPSTTAETSSPTRAATPTPIPTLASTTENATVAPSGAILIEMKALGGGSARFAPDQTTAKTGTVVFFLKNVRGVLMQVDHNMVIGPEIYKVLARSSFVRAEESAIFTVQGLTPGSYTFWCEVGTHAANGQVGTLTVTP
jgi:plastocyanin